MNTTAGSGVGFWAGYWKSLKPLSVEEPIDVWVHRPLAYLLVRACLPTPVSANALTFASIFFGLGSGWCFVSPFPDHLRAAGLLLFLATIFDCADGQLARLRGTSSRFGRMLDGSADLFVLVAAVGGAGWVLWERYSEPAWQGALVVVALAVTAVTSSFHTTMYDHYKNVFLRMTAPNHPEGEGYADALARYREKPAAEFGPIARLTWPVYLFYVKSQEDYVTKFDPNQPHPISTLPAYTDEGARIYDEQVGPVMRVWRDWFGLGSLVFGISAAAVFDLLEVYLVLRLVVLNAFYYGYLQPAQRRVSGIAFGAIRQLAASR